MLSNISIRSKITLPYLILSAITALSIGVISVKLIFENVDERFNNQLYETHIVVNPNVKTTK